jgi:hypothetical protein
MMIPTLVLLAVAAAAMSAQPADVSQVSAEINKQLLASASASYPNDKFMSLSGNGPWPYYFNNLGDHFTPCFQFIAQSLVDDSPEVDQYKAESSYFTTYASIVNKLGFQLSDADQQRRNAAQLKSESQLNTLVGAYINYIGPLTSSGTARSDELIAKIGAWTASGQLTLADQATIVKASPTALLKLFPKAPLKAGMVLPAFQTYLLAVSDVQDLIALQSQAARVQASLKANSGADGPLADASSGADRYNDNGVVSFKPGFTVTPANQIEANLQQNAGQFSYTFSVTKNEDKTSTVEGHGGLSFTIPIVEWVTGSGSVGGRSKTSTAFSDHSTTTVTMDFSGIGVADVAAMPFDISNGAGWFASSYLRDALAREAGETGPVFVTPLSAAERNLLGLAKVVYGATPKVTIEYNGVVTDDIKQSWSVGGSGGFTFFGLINIGGGGSTAHSSETFSSTSNSFKYTYTPPVVLTQTMPERTVFVFGVSAAPLFAAAAPSPRRFMAAMPPHEHVQKVNASIVVDASKLQVHGAAGLQLVVHESSLRIDAGEKTCVSGSLLVSAVSDHSSASSMAAPMLGATVLAGTQCNDASTFPNLSATQWACVNGLAGVKQFVGTGYTLLYRSASTKDTAHFAYQSNTQGAAAHFTCRALSTHAGRHLGARSQRGAQAWLDGGCCAGSGWPKDAHKDMQWLIHTIGQCL